VFAQHAAVCALLLLLLLLLQAVRSLSVAVAGALLLLVGQSLLFGYLASQAVHAARDLEDLLRHGDGLLVVSGAVGVAAAAAGSHTTDT
jgi:hypothetical protein